MVACHNVDWHVIVADQPAASQERDGTAANDDRQATHDAGAAGLFADTTPEEAAQEYLETQRRQRRDAAGIDDRADGLPSIEEARTLVRSLARVVGDADGDVVTLQDALRRIATNSPDRLFAPPIFPALVKLRLDDRPEWERFKSMLGNSSPPGLPLRCASAMTRWRSGADSGRCAARRTPLPAIRASSSSPGLK